MVIAYQEPLLCPILLLFAFTNTLFSHLCVVGQIGWGFFILQSWIPPYLDSLGLSDLAGVGALAALPWLVPLLLYTYLPLRKHRSTMA